MDKRRIRQKAQDVFNEQTFLLGKTSSFEKAFPDIEKIKVHVIESDGCHDKERTYSNNSLPGEYVNCSNPRCYNGGFDLGGIIRNMGYRSDTQFEGTRLCQGYEGSPKGRNNYGPCDRLFKVSISVQYKPKSEVYKVST